MYDKVRKRDGRYAQYDITKIAKAILNALSHHGVKDDKIAYKLAIEVEESLIKKYETSKRVSYSIEDIQDEVENVLMNHGYNDAAKEYILYRQQRTNIRESNTSLMNTLKEVMNADARDSDLKRDNANVDGNTAMGSMLQVGSAATKAYNTYHLLKKEHAEAYKNGDIHIHDFDFYNITSTCLCGDTEVVIKLLYNNSITKVNIDTFDFVLNNVEVDIPVKLNNIEILSKGKFVKLINCVRHNTKNKKILKIDTSNGHLKLTNNHIVSVVKNKNDLDNNKVIDIKAEDIKVGYFLIKDEPNSWFRGYSEVTEIKELEYNDYVYDLETENHYFSANGFTVHNCCQIDIVKLFENGFSTGHGYLREPNDVQSYSALACIAIQSNQNDQHGGQSIPNFDYGIAKGVEKTYKKLYYDNLDKAIELNPPNSVLFYKDKEKNICLDIEEDIDEYPKLNQECKFKQILKSCLINSGGENYANRILKFVENRTNKETDKKTYQAMESLIHNLNSMHSRAGAQVPFSSINYGTDISEEGRLVIKNVLLATEKGLGHGETPIFPIQIFKLKDGVNYKEEDKNYDLFELACKVSAKRLFPNFSNLDVDFNNQYYIEGKPETEVATMGAVGEDETVKYKLNNILYIDTFKDFYNRIEELGLPLKIQGNSEYFDTDNINLKIYDTISSGYVKVKIVLRNKNTKNMRIVKFSNGRSLEATGDHPLPIINKGRTFVDNLKKGDKIRISKECFIEQQNVFYSEYFKDETYLLGLILADGNYNQDIKCSFGLDEEDIVYNMKECVENLGYSVNIKKQERGKKGSYFDVSIISGKNLKNLRHELFNIFGGYKKIDRRIPSNLLTSSKQQRLNLLAGLMDADGHVSCNKRNKNKLNSFRFSLGSTNKKLALTELELIRGLGYKAKLYRNYYKKDSNKVRFLIEFEIKDELIYLLKSEKKKKKANNGNRQLFTEPRFASVKEISSIIPDNEKYEFSYDVKTESDTFDVSGLCSHNCRTRVMGNVYENDKQIAYGRGNLSFTSINLPRIAIESNGDIDLFYSKLKESLDLVSEQLLDRYAIQSKKKVRNYPFLMGQGIWLDSDKLSLDDEVGDVLKHGTLSIGFIGLAETLVSLYGKHHGESDEMQDKGIEIVNFMHEYCKEQSNIHKMNFTLLATPAEGLSGRFIKMDAKKYGKIDGVTDKEFYTNSFHIPVYYNISAYDKIKKEAPYHALTPAGHISYVELDGDTANNVEAFMSIVKCMHDSGVGYGSINHPVDRDPVCGYVGIINDVCPRCGRKDGEAIPEDKVEELSKKYPNILEFNT